MKVLVVEDDADTRHILQLILQRAGLDVVLTERGQQALAQVAQERPDLVLCDLYLPEMSGYEVLQAIRRTPELDHLPMIVISCDSMPEDVQKALQAGAVRYVIKPFGARQLLEVIKQQLAL